MLNSKKIILSLSTIIAAYAGYGCGSTTTTTTATSDLETVSLDKLPSVSGLVTASGSSAKLGFGVDAGELAVSGTPPKLGDISDAAADTYFWNGLVATINATSGSISQAQANQFFGQVAGGPAGNGACMMAQTVAESLSRILQSGGTACYMKGIAKVKSGVTVTGAAQDSVFAQTDADKLVKIAISGMERGGHDSKVNAAATGDVSVFIKVYGKTSMGADKYKVGMYMCQGGVADQIETMEVDKVLGTYKTTSGQDGSDGVGAESITAYIKKDGESIVFDKTKSRTASNFYTGSWGKFRGELTVSGDNVITAKLLNKSSWGTDKNYSITSFTGASMKEISFTDGAFKGQNSQENNSYVNNYSGATEFQDTYYKAIASSSKLTTVQAYDFAADEFFTKIDAPTIDLSAADCSATATVNVTMDFTDTAIVALKETCEGDRFDNYDMCWNSDVQDAMTKVFSGMNQQGQ